jgi:hypothetical protein
MRYKEFRQLDETAEETQDIAQITRKVIEFLGHHPEYTEARNNLMLDLDKIPGITANTPRGQLLINGIRLSVRSISALGQTRNMLSVEPGVWPPEVAGIGRRIKPSDIATLKNGSGDKIGSRELQRYFDADQKLHVEINRDFNFKTEGPEIFSTLVHEFTHDLDMIKGAPLGAQRSKVDANTRARDNLDKGPQPKSAPKYDPKYPVDYMQNVYMQNMNEINARFAQAAIYIGQHTSGTDSPEQIKYTIKEAFNKNSLISVLIPKDALDKLITTRDYTFDEYWNEAMKSADFRRLISRAYAVVEAEMKNPVIATATLDIPGTAPRPQPPALPPTKPIDWYNRGDKSKSFIDRTLNDPHQNPFKDLAGRITQALDRLFKGEFIPLVEKIKAFYKEAPLTGRAGRLFQNTNRAFFTVATIMQVADVIYQIYQLPTDRMSPEDTRKEVSRILGSAIAKFGVVYVSCIVGSIAATSAFAWSGPGALVAGLIGFTGGMVAGFLADHYLGDDVDDLVDTLMDQLYANSKNTDPKEIPRSGKQGAANARDALRNYSTAGNPAPLKESLTRIIELAVVKKPTEAGF